MWRAATASGSPTMPMMMFRQAGRPTARASPMSRGKAGEPCRIMVATVPAGEAARSAAAPIPISSIVSWQPGTSFLYYHRPAPGLNRRHSIFRLDLDSGALPAARPSCKKTDAAVPGNRASAMFAGRQVAALYLGRDRRGWRHRHPRSRQRDGTRAGPDPRRLVRPPGPRIPLPCLPPPPAASAARSRPIPWMAPRLTASMPPRRVSAIWRPARGGLLALETDPSRENLARATPDADGAARYHRCRQWPKLGADLRAGWHTGLSVKPFRHQRHLGDEAGRCACFVVRCRPCAHVPPGILARRHQAGRRDCPSQRHHHQNSGAEWRGDHVFRFTDPGVRKPLLDAGWQRGDPVRSLADAGGVCFDR